MLSAIKHCRRVLSTALGLCTFYALPALASIPYSDWSDSKSSCGKFILRTDKSYIAFDSKYRMLFAKLDCGSQIIPKGVEGRLVYEYRYIKNPPNEAGYRDMYDANGNLTQEWSNSGTFTITPTSKSYWDIQVRLADVRRQFGNDLTSIAVLFRARPENEPDNWSRWIQVNYDTPYGLWDTRPLWNYDNGDITFNGNNFMLLLRDPITQAKTGTHPSFEAKIGKRAKYGFTPIMRDEADQQIMNEKAKTLTDSAQYVHVYTKSERRGYHDRPWPWLAHRLGISNIIFWYRDNATMPEGNEKEEYIVMDYAEYRMPDFTNWQSLDSVKDKPLANNGERLHLANPSDNPNNYFRDYIFSPRYVGEGWGIATNHKNPAMGGRTGLWAAHADVIKSSKLPGANESWAREYPYVLQLKYWEGDIGSFTNSNLSMHREDWFFDQYGAVRVEGRAFLANIKSIQESQGDFVNQTPIPAVESMDALANQYIEKPNFCMSRVGTAECSLSGR